MADQLDRLFNLLVRRIEQLRPEYLSRAFLASEISRVFVSYRSTRSSLRVETAEEYELLLLRLLSGERGLIISDVTKQDALRRELNSGNPDLRMLEAYGAEKVSLAATAMQQALEPAEAAAHSRAPECRFCGEPLPQGRSTTYCPACGQQLDPLLCAACNAEIESTWRFCVHCGRPNSS